DVLKVNPEYSDGNTSLGWVLFTTSKVAEAKPYFQKAIEEDSLQTKAYLGLAECLVQQGDTAQSAVVMDKGVSNLKERQLNAGYFQNAAQFFQRVKMYDKAQLYTDKFNRSKVMQ